MNAFDILAILTTLAALFSYLNYRHIRLPTTIGLMVLSLGFSLALVTLGRIFPAIEAPFQDLLAKVDFNETLLNGMLGALLFAGALHLNLNDLAEQKFVITLLATVGVLLSTAMVGLATWTAAPWLGFDIPLVYALLFGALISPTDPVAVGSILRRLGVPRSLQTKISGESLFNDGIGVVVFLVLLGLVSGGGHLSAAGVLHLLALEAGGGVVYGAALGWVAYRMLRSVDSYQVEILITLAVVTGGYSAAQLLHVSGPLAMVVAGLLIGNHGRAFAMSERTRERLDAFWEMADDFLNALLFVLIGIEIMILKFSLPYLAAGLLAIPLVLVARYLSVGLPVLLLSRWRPFTRNVVPILTWCGLRGGISVALALAVPAGPHRPLLLTATYVVVIFSIVVQGITVERVTARLLRDATP